jgi:hypothetical protein
MDDTTMSVAAPTAFVKHYANDQFASELAKARLLAEAGSATGVRVPGVLDADEVAGLIRYEHVECPVSLLDLMSSRTATMEEILCRVVAAGAALGALHQLLPVEGFPHHRRALAFDRELGPEPTAGGGRLVLQHGDFGYSNVRFGPTGELVVIDPSPNHYVSVDALNVDHPELDLALIGSNFLGRTVRPLAMARTVGRGPDLFAALLEGYEGAGERIDRGRLRVYSVATVRAFARWCGRGRPQVLVPLARLLERNLP